MEYSKTKLPFVSRKKYNNLLKDYEDVNNKLKSLVCRMTGKNLPAFAYPLDQIGEASAEYAKELWCGLAAKELAAGKKNFRFEW